VRSDALLSTADTICQGGTLSEDGLEIIVTFFATVVMRISVLFDFWPSFSASA